MSGVRDGTGTQAFGTIVIVGGGCYGTWYARQLGRARAAGAVRWDRLVAVDRDPECRLAGMLARKRETGPRGAPPERHDAAPSAPTDHHSIPTDIAVATAPWDTFFADYLADAARRPDAASRDAIVPSPLMPHLMYGWLLARARARWPDRPVRTLPLPRAPHTPWTREAPDATTYVSFAEWMCPINCIEPARCPVTRGPRDWSLPPAVRAYVDAVRAEGEPLDGPVVFHCTHRAYGVGMLDTRDVLDADAFVARAGTAGPARVLVGTVSHCHGALNLLAIS